MNNLCAIEIGILYRMNFPNGKSYIGITKNGLRKRFNDHICASSRLESSYAVHRAIRKHGKECVWIETLVKADYKYLKDLEIRAISKFNTRVPYGYNLTAGGDGTVGVVRSPETLERMRLASLGSKRSEATKQRMRVAHSGKKFSQEHKNKIGMVHKGKVVSDDTRKKISASKIGLIMGEDSRLKMSLARKGKKKSIETRAKMGAWQIGRKLSEATIIKREATKAVNRLNAQNGIPL